MSYGKEQGRGRKIMVRIHSGPSPARVLHRPVIDVTGVHVLDTIYQNTSGRPMLVFVSALCTRMANGEIAHIHGEVDTVTPPVSIQSYNGLAVGAPAETAEVMQAFIVMAVPNNSYFRAVSTTGGASTVVLSGWVEVTL